MNTRIIAIATLAFGVASCGTNDHNSSLIVNKVVLGKFTAAAPPATGGTCALSAGDDEISLPDFNPTGPNQRGAIGLVVRNELLDTSTINSQLNLNSATFNAHQAVITYDIPGTSVPQQIVPVSGTVQTGSDTPVVVEVFAPAAAFSAVSGLAANTFVRTTTRIEGQLNDGTTVSTSAHEYVINVCPGCPTTNPCF